MTDIAVATNKYRPEYRLRQAYHFNNVFDKCILKIHSDSFTLLAATNSQSNDAFINSELGSKARLGFIVAKKKIKLAHNRNQFKRIIRDSFRCNRHLLPALDIVFIAKSNKMLVDKEKLHQHVLHAWQSLVQKHQQLQNMKH